MKPSRRHFRRRFDLWICRNKKVPRPKPGRLRLLVDWLVILNERFDENECATPRPNRECVELHGEARFSVFSCEGHTYGRPIARTGASFGAHIVGDLALLGLLTTPRAGVCLTAHCNVLFSRFVDLIERGWGFPSGLSYGRSLAGHEASGNPYQRTGAAIFSYSPIHVRCSDRMLSLTVGITEEISP
jgi:hypothetical protein